LIILDLFKFGEVSIMKEYIFKKGIVGIIIGLFVITSTIPLVGGFVIDYANKYLSDNLVENLESDNWWDPDWRYCKSISINHNLVAEDLQDFPILVYDISSDYTNHAQSDGDDFVFVSMDNTTTYDHEIEYYSRSSGELVSWVKIPEVSSFVDTVFYMYYGNPSCGNQQNPENVWDSNYIHVWHLGDSLVDSVGPDDGSNHGTSVVSGKIGEARDFERDHGDYVDLGDMNQPCNDILTTGTLEFWVNAEELGQRNFIATKYDTTGTDYQSYAAWIEASGKLAIVFYHQNYDHWFRYISNQVVITPGSWCHVAFRITIGTTRVVRFYVDGDRVFATKSTQGSQPTTFKDIPRSDILGAIPFEESWEYSDAIVDEMRWSKDVKSEEWIETSYNTMNDPFNFINIGLENSHNEPPIAPLISGPTTGKAGVSIIISATSIDPDNDKVYYWFDWGDNSNTGWVGPYDSGVIAEESHIWDNEGDFHIKVKAKDVLDTESPWSGFDISIPRTRTSHYSILLDYLGRFPLLEKIFYQVIIG
jgi:hypothetical protein